MGCGCTNAKADPRWGGWPIPSLVVLIQLYRFGPIVPWNGCVLARITPEMLDSVRGTVIGGAACVPKDRRAKARAASLVWLVASGMNTEGA